MKTLKRTLCLVLVLAMSVGFFAFGAGAKFDDADEITDAYVEAVDVLVALGIVDGMGNNLLAPDGNFTRGQAAKIIAYLLLGANAADALGAANPFPDVAATHWASGYINYCAKAGIVNGYEDGKFYPNNNVTGYEFLKMLMAAVGYGVNGEFVGTMWAVNVFKLALNQGVLEDSECLNYNAAARRDEAMYYAFMTLAYVNVVSYSDLLGEYLPSSLAGIILGTNTSATLGLQNYNLRRNENMKNGYGYVCHAWYVGSSYTTRTAITGMYIDGEIVDSMYVTGALKWSAIGAGYTFNPGTTLITGAVDGGVGYYVNGQLEGTYDTTFMTSLKTNTATIASTAPTALGALLTLVDSDKDGDVDSIIVVVGYLAKVDSVTAATGAAARKINLTVYTATGTGSWSCSVETADYVKGDMLWFVPSNNRDQSGTVKPLELDYADGVSNVAVTGFSGSANVTFGGATYGYSGEFGYDTAIRGAYVYGATYNFYFDAAGNVLGAEVYTPGTANLNYVYVTAAQCQITDTNLFGGTAAVAAKAQVYYMDGTSAILDLKVNRVTAADSPVTGYAVGDYYVTIGSGASVSYAKLPTVSGTISNLPLGMYSYTSSSGTIYLSAAANAGEIAPGSTLTAKANVAATGATGTAGAALYANAGTKLVIVNKAGTITSYDGYANFPGTAAAGSGEFTASNTTGSELRIGYAWNGSFLTGILIIGTDAPSLFAGDYAVATGQTRSATGTGGYVTEHQLNVDGVSGWYALNTGDATPLTARTTWAMTKNADGTVTLASVGTAATNIKLASAGYIVLSDDSILYFASNYKSFDISGAAGDWADSDLEAKDNITYVLNGNSQIVRAYITSVTP